MFSIPNPLFYIDVAKYLGQRRNQIDLFLKSHKYSSSHLFLPQSRDGLMSGFSNFIDDRQSKLAHYPIILKVDIARFYPSIYTHSIPWAMHGKEPAKQDMKPNSSNIYGNKLDQIIRNAQHGQTLGIPVGPITSRLISEIIAIGIEQKFQSILGDMSLDAVRYVDDIYFGVNSEEDGNKILSYYREALAEFELEINDSKLSIEPSKYLLTESWPLKIRQRIKVLEQLSSSKPNQREFSIFLDSIMKLANDTKNDSILVYAIKVFKNLQLLRKFWQQLEQFLMKVAVNFSHPFKNVAWLVAYKHSLTPQEVDTPRWKSICHNIISKHAPLGHDDEVCWACWLLKRLGGNIKPHQFEIILKRCGPFSALLAVDFAHHANDPKSYNTSLVKKRVSDNNTKNEYMIGKDWILSYEAERLFGYRFKAKNRMHYKHFGKLMECDVSFYEPDVRSTLASSLFDDDYG